MPHLYEIASGRWTHDGVLVGIGHSGTDLDGDGVRSHFHGRM